MNHQKNKEMDPQENQKKVKAVVILHVKEEVIQHGKVLANQHSRASKIPIVKVNN